jgi:hypothetical protein
MDPIQKAAPLQHNWSGHSGGYGGPPCGAAGLRRVDHLSGAGGPYRSVLVFTTGKEEHSMDMKGLVENVAKSLVDNPDQVEVTEIEGLQTSVIELRVAKEDMGKIIGKQGRNAKAIRTILGAASTKINRNTVLEIVEWRGS